MRTRSVIAAAIIVAGVWCFGCAPYPYERFTPRAAPALGELRDDHALINVYYATDRAPTGSDDPYLYYGAERCDDLEYGAAVVSIPADHGRGRLERPLFGAPRRAARHVALLRVDPLDDSAAFEQRLKAALDRSPQRSVLVYIHGFNSLMGDSARRGAQIAHDTEFEGPVVLYSWPTQGWLLSYLVDASNVEWTTPHLAEFLRMLRAQGGVERIHLLAHSMGCRVLCRAVERIRNAAPDDEPMFDQIVLAAADVDAQLFERDYLPALSRAARRVTAYVSRADWALGSSRWLHKYPRLGLDGPPEIPPRTPTPFDVIDATLVDKGPVGHYYFGNSPDVLRDLAGVLAGRSPVERGLVGADGQFRIEPRVRSSAGK